MKHLRLIHAWLGLITTFLALAAGTILQNLHPANYTDQSLADTAANPVVQTLLFAAAINLVLGCYLRPPFCKYRKIFVALGSLCVIAGAVSSAFVIFANTLDLNCLAVALLFAGPVMMFLGNLNALRSDKSEPSISDDREVGVVKWFNVSKGFGFISRENGEDVFVHFRSIRGEGHRTLMEGQRVEFLLTHKEKGLQAEDVIPAPGKN